MPLRARLWTGLLLLALPAHALVAPEARAEPKPPAASANPRAAALFREGRAAMAREDYRAACPKFQESADLEPAPGTLLNLALCRESLGEHARALRGYRQALARLPEGDERIPFAKEQAAALEAQVALLAVRIAPDVGPGARVLYDGEALSDEEIGAEMPVDPGQHEIVLEVPGAEPVRRRVSLVAGERRTISMGDQPAEGAAAPGAAGGPFGLSQTQLGLIAGGVGAVGLTASLITGAMVLGKKATVEAECGPTTCRSQEGVDAASAGSTLAAVSTVTFIVGVLGLGAGGYLILTDDEPAAAGARREARARAATLVGPSVLPGGGGLFVWRRF